VMCGCRVQTAMDDDGKCKVGWMGQLVTAKNRWAGSNRHRMVHEIT
jgi:hypothetical protein